MSLAGDELFDQTQVRVRIFEPGGVIGPGQFHKPSTLDVISQVPALFEGVRAISGTVKHQRWRRDRRKHSPNVERRIHAI
jgi:hypothetical protein